MKSERPLNDSWLFWNAERLEEFPHVPEDDYACATADGDAEEDEQDSPRLAVLGEFLLYIGGVSAALVGVGLVVLIGSFLSAYSALNGPGESQHTVVPARPRISLQRLAPLSKAAPREAIVVEAVPSGMPTRRQTSPTQDAGYSRKPSEI